MTEIEIVGMLRECSEGLFPRTCPKCGCPFATLREYIRASQPLWPTLSYDIELGDYETLHPIGILAMANCSCGTTLALSSKRMPLSQTHQILDWIRTETGRRGLDSKDLLNHVREEIRNQVLNEPIQEVASGLKENNKPDQSPDPKPAPATRAAEEAPCRPKAADHSYVRQRHGACVRDQARPVARNPAKT
jgi:hypothetical protein